MTWNTDHYKLLQVNSESYPVCGSYFSGFFSELCRRLAAFCLKNNNKIKRLYKG